jgi:hypothetical protein
MFAILEILMYDVTPCRYLKGCTKRKMVKIEWKWIQMKFTMASSRMCMFGKKI